MAAYITPLPLASRPIPYRAALQCLLVLLLCVEAALCWSARHRSLNAKVDLWAFYSAGVLARVGDLRHVYDDSAEQRTQQAIFHDGSETLHFLYPPFAALPCALLACAPYKAAFLLVFVGDFAALFLCALLLAREHHDWHCRPLLLFAVLLVPLPSAVALMQGQVSFALLLLFTLFYTLERQGKPLLAGLCLALCLVKFQIALPVVLLYAAWRRWRVIAGFALGAGALFALSWAITGVAGLVGYLHRLQSVGSSTLLDQAGAHLRYGMQVAGEPNLHGVVSAAMGAGSAGVAVTLGASMLVLLLSAVYGRGIASALPAAMLASYHMQPYDLLLLSLPLLLLAVPLLREVDDAHQQPVATWLLAGSALLLVAPAAHLLLLCHGAVCFVVPVAAVLLAACLPSVAETPEMEQA